MSVEPEAVTCPFFGGPCPHDGSECDEGCEADAESDPAADRGDWRFHQDHDQ